MKAWPTGPSALRGLAAVLSSISCHVLRWAHYGKRTTVVQRLLSNAVMLWSLHASATAQQPTCILQAVEKKLAGPARTTFLAKCEAEMERLCEKMMPCLVSSAPHEWEYACLNRRLLAPRFSLPPP